MPCDIDPARAGDEAGQYVDMLLANSDGYRANYTVIEEAAALFAAHEAGASRTRLRKATGRTAAQVKTALAAGSLPAETRAKAAEASPDLTLEDLALLAEFDGDDRRHRPAARQPGATATPSSTPPSRSARTAPRPPSTPASAPTSKPPASTVTDQLPDGAAWLTSLTHDGQDLTPDTHAACPGHGATFNAVEPAPARLVLRQPRRPRPRQPLALIGPSTGTSGTSDMAGQPGSPATAGRRPPPDPAQPDTGPAAGHRREQGLAGRRRGPAPLAHRLASSPARPRPARPSEFLARQLLAMPSPLRSRPGRRHGQDRCSPSSPATTAPSGSRPAPPRRPDGCVIVMLAPVITAYEHAMTDAEGRNTWRTDRYSPCPRPDAAAYLTFLAASATSCRPSNRPSPTVSRTPATPTRPALSSVPASRTTATPGPATAPTGVRSVTTATTPMTRPTPRPDQPVRSQGRQPCDWRP